jgi:hypothetical protein
VTFNGYPSQKLEWEIEDPPVFHFFQFVNERQTSLDSMETCWSRLSDQLINHDEMSTCEDKGRVDEKKSRAMIEIEISVVSHFLWLNIAFLWYKKS